MNPFVPSGKRGGVCPICGKTNGNCRTIHNPKYPNPAFLCMTYPNPTSDIPQGFRFTRTSKDGLWGIFVTDNSNSLQRNTIYKQTSSYKKDSIIDDSWVGFREQAGAKDRQWRNFIRLPGFRLTGVEEQELRRRGLKSWGNIPFIKHYVGIGIPILFPGDKIIAYQVRNLSPTAEQRYIWFSPKVSNKDLIRDIKLCNKTPIGFYGTPESDTVFICEGYLKACLAHFLHNETTVGLGSHINIQQSYELLKYYLDNMKNLEFIYIAPDKDVFTNEIVKKSLINLESRLKKDYPDKAINCLSWEGHNLYDIDEIPQDSKLKVMSFDSMFSYGGMERESELVL